MSLYYRYIYKDSNGNAFASVDPGGYIGAFDNTAETRLEYPRKTTISVYHIPAPGSLYYEECGGEHAIKIEALTNTINFYRANSKYYDINYYKNKEATLINIPSAIYGSYIKRGSFSLKFFYDGTKIGELQDIKQNGELVQVYPTSSLLGYKKTAGIVLYNEGFAILTGSWDINNTVQDNYIYCDYSRDTQLDNPKWIYWGKGLDKAPILSSSFDIDFEGTTKINTLTMFANAPASELNFSQNPTFIEYGQTSSVTTQGTEYIENPYRKIKNTVASGYEDITGSFKRQTFINKINIYDSDKNLIAIAKLATPVKKTDSRSITFKLKLDT